MKFHINTLHSLKVMLRTKFKNENEQRAISPKVRAIELWFLCTALLLNEIYLSMKFQVSSLNTYWVILRTKFKNENEVLIINILLWVMVLVHCTSPQWHHMPMKRTITLKVWCWELWFLCTALLLDEIYLPMKFHVDALHTFKVMLWTKKGRTGGQTDGLTDWRTDRLTEWLTDRGTDWLVDYYMPPIGA